MTGVLKDMGSKSSVGEKLWQKWNLDRGHPNCDRVVSNYRICCVCVDTRRNGDGQPCRGECVEMGADSCTITLTTRVRYTIYITEFLTQRYNNTIQINPRPAYKYGRIKYKSNDREKLKYIEYKRVSRSKWKVWIYVVGCHQKRKAASGASKPSM